MDLRLWAIVFAALAALGVGLGQLVGGQLARLLAVLGVASAAASLVFCLVIANT